MTNHTEDLSAHDARVRAAAMEEAAKVLDIFRDEDRQLCCDGRECGCRGATVFGMLEDAIRALAATPPGYVCVPVEPTREICEAMQRMPALTVEDLQLSQAGWSMGAIQNARRYRAITTSAKE